MTTTDTTSVHLDAAVLQGLTYEILARLSSAGEALYHSAGGRLTYDLDGIVEARLDGANVRRHLDLLEQIGWQTTEPRTVTGSHSYLQELFTDIATDSEACVADLTDNGATWTDPDGSLANYRSALAGADQALAQLGGRLPAAAGVA